MIPEEYKDDIITAGIDFMNAITRAYGTEDGLALYDTIMASVDPDIKGKIFFALIMGGHEGSFRLKRVDRGISSKVERIKAVRQVSNSSLKDAKDLVEAVELGIPKSISHIRANMSRADAVATLKNVGFIL